MDARTLKALKASIEKWEGNARAESPELYLTSPKDCPLCQLFFANGACKGCPIMSRSGYTCCAETPYENAEDIHSTWEDEYYFNAESDKELALARKARQAAQEEVEFLKSLLPDGEE